MNCPYCAHDDSRVIDSRETENKPEVKGSGSIRRRRECLQCHQRYTSYERIERAGLAVVKKDGKREEYDPSKLRRGVATACYRRPIPAEAVDRLVEEVEAEVFGRGVAEVPSRAIGELVMARLRALDDIAYIRFASVYLSYDSLQELLTAIERTEHS